VTAEDTQKAETPAATPDRVNVATPEGPELELPTTEPSTDPAPCSETDEASCTEQEGAAAEETDPAAAPVLFLPQLVPQLLQDSADKPVRDDPSRSKEPPIIDSVVFPSGDRGGDPSR
jgi:hypothetical protein